MTTAVRHALAQLETERDGLRARLGRLDVALERLTVAVTMSSPMPTKATFSPAETRILAALKLGPANGPKLAEALGLSIWTAGDALRQLATHQHVHMVGGGRGAKWHLGPRPGRREPTTEEDSRG